MLLQFNKNFTTFRLPVFYRISPRVCCALNLYREHQVLLSTAYPTVENGNFTLLNIVMFIYADLT